jgi:hypothetical protein
MSAGRVLFDHRQIGVYLRRFAGLYSNKGGHLLGKIAANQPSHNFTGLGGVRQRIQ